MHARRVIPMTTLGLIVAGVTVIAGSPPAHASPEGSVAVNAGRLEVTNPTAGIFGMSVQDGFDVGGQHHPETAVRIDWFGGFDGGFVESAPECFQDEQTTVFCELAALDSYQLRTSNQGDFIDVDVPLDGTIDAGGGGDHIEAVGVGVDEVHGGTGTDLVDYGARTTGVVVSLDGLANDGRGTGFNQDGGFTNEHDNIHPDVEMVAGTESSDFLTGSSAENWLDGRGGRDTFYLSAGGADHVTGGGGADEARFRGYTSGVDVSLDGLANDGAPGQDSDIDGVEDVQGTPYGDTVVGDGADNLLDGYTGGVDVLRGLGGDDQLEGEQSSATLDGGDGDDVLHAGRVGGSTITGGVGTDLVTYQGADGPVKVVLDSIRNDGPGSDLVQTVENIEGGGFSDTLTGNAGPNVIDGGYPLNPQHGPDNDTISGQGGNDTFPADTNGGKDVFSGGGGIDTADFHGTPSSVTVTLDNVANDFPSQANVKTDIETVIGGWGNDFLTGSGARNELDGGHGDDHLWGGGGNDFLDGGEGADELNGGAGVDQVTYRDAPVGVRVTIDGNADDGTSSEGDNVQTDVENVRGSDWPDLLTGSPVANQLLGGVSDDQITGLGGNDVLDGGEGDDTFRAGSAKDGADRFSGGNGFDTVDYSHRVKPLTVNVNGSAGDGEAAEGDKVGTDVDEVDGGSGDDKLTAATVGTYLVGGAGNDTLQGSGARDWFVPGTGSDDVRGGGGTDYVSYEERTADLFVALDDLNQDGVSGEADNIHSDVENIIGGSGDDFLIGGFSDSMIWGGGGVDVIDGAGGNDTMYGEAGNDDIDGANGTDTANGGLGTDECVAETRVQCEF